MTQQAERTGTAIRRTLIVNAPRDRAFVVFAERFGTWWPRDHHLGEADLAEAIIEPAAGGRLYERNVDGSEHDWGRVLVYEPPHRLVLAWHLQGDWKFNPDPAKASEVEVRFLAEGPDRTRVEFEHRHIERHDGAADVLRGVDASNGWSDNLGRYVAVTAPTAA
ncbi:MAG TPA: SRPBCC family protein [Actinophytocola sp.]|uniref:SRPBCC family protein n=1 Tax=Actinophytocola sp. TaxID=1872138 RepID=UPI002DBA46E7|nr:SRPBCC family protein [Actinophytocola sp.]HEU5472192.1 SRPBCC family protein [Actinophytocola sp.]